MRKRIPFRLLLHGRLSIAITIFYSQSHYQTCSWQGWLQTFFLLSPTHRNIILTLIKLSWGPREAKSYFFSKPRGWRNHSRKNVNNKSPRIFAPAVKTYRSCECELDVMIQRRLKDERENLYFPENSSRDFVAEKIWNFYYLVIVPRLLNPLMKFVEVFAVQKHQRRREAQVKWETNWYRVSIIETSFHFINFQQRNEWKLNCIIETTRIAG